jgi:hypothetical protein
VVEYDKRPIRRPVALLFMALSNRLQKDIRAKVLRRLSDMQKSQKGILCARGEIVTKAATSSRHGTCSLRWPLLVLLVLCVQMHALICQRNSTNAKLALNRWSSRRIFEFPLFLAYPRGGQTRVFDSIN